MSIVGKCNACADCCRVISMFLPVTQDTVEWLNARGLYAVQISQGKNAHVEVHVPHVCKNLVRTVKKSKIVRMFGKDEPAEIEYACRLQGAKPKVCSMYPSKQHKKFLESMGLTLKDSLSKKCGYKVEDRNNGNG